MKERFAICFAQLLLGAVCFAQTPNEKTEYYLEKQMRERQIPGLQLSVIKSDRIIFSDSKGLADVAFQVTVSDSTIFSINSTAKIFAGVGLMQLVEAGKVRLDDPIGWHIDSLPQSWQNITLSQLMGHVSGLPDVEDERTDGLVGGPCESNAWQTVRRLPPLSKPGEMFYYNATNYLLIQKVLEKYSGKPYEAWIQKEQFSVAGMPRTFFANSDEVVANKAPTYSHYYRDPVSGEYVKINWLRQIHEVFPRMMRTDAGAFSTAHELARWIIALKNGRLLKQPETLPSLWAPVQLNSGKTEGFGDAFTGYAMGWPVMKRRAHPALAAIGGGRCVVMVYPKDDITVILLTNLSGCAPEEMADVIAGYYFDR